MRGKELGERKPPFKIRSVNDASFLPLVPKRQWSADPADQPQSSAQADQEQAEHPEPTTMAAGVSKCALASIAQTRLRGSSVTGWDTLPPDGRSGRLTGVSPKSFAREKVGRAVLSAP